jgi:DUF2905 family protein
MNGVNGNSGFGWMLIIVGLVIAGIGLIWVLAPSLPPLGRLPGDIVIERQNSRFHFPIGLDIAQGDGLLREPLFQHRRAARHAAEHAEVRGWGDDETVLHELREEERFRIVRLPRVGRDLLRVAMSDRQVAAIAHEVVRRGDIALIFMLKEDRRAADLKQDLVWGNAHNPQSVGLGMSRRRLQRCSEPDHSNEADSEREITCFHDHSLLQQSSYVEGRRLQCGRQW